MRAPPWMVSLATAGPGYLAAWRSIPRTPYEGTVAPSPNSRQAQGLVPVRGGRCRWEGCYASPSAQGCARGRNARQGHIRFAPREVEQALPNAVHGAQTEPGEGSVDQGEGRIELAVEKMVPKECPEQGPVLASASRKTQLSAYEGSVARWSRLRGGTSHVFLRTRKQCHEYRALALPRGLSAGGWLCLLRIACVQVAHRLQRLLGWSAERWVTVPRLQVQSRASGWAHQGWRPR